TANGKRQTANGKRQTANGKRQTANGKRQTANGKRQTANGKRQTANGKRQTANGKRQTALASRAPTRAHTSRSPPANMYPTPHSPSQSVATDDFFLHIPLSTTKSTYRRRRGCGYKRIRA
ncbi:hypothetical protein, partial [Burkholderia vietnamiensis]|uniref:hypothetical protein n=1 Tax=Burkholderia vietnamiensis TaxID=60552 RepID=UPI00244568ED